MTGLVADVDYVGTSNNVPAVDGYGQTYTGYTNDEGADGILVRFYLDGTAYRFPIMIPLEIVEEPGPQTYQVGSMTLTVKSE